MGITLAALRAFVAVARTGSFSAAAHLLAVRQPTVSEAVRRFEADAGQPLLHRLQDHIELTEFGLRVLQHAAATVDAAAGLDALLRGTTPELVVGFMGEAAARHTRRLLALIQRHSDLPLRLTRYDYDDPSCGLAAGHTDLAIVWPPLSTPGIRLLTIGTDQRAVALPATDPLAKLDQITPAQLAGRVWITPRSADAGWARYRHPHTVGVDDVAGTLLAGSIEETLELVGAERGAALVSGSTDEHYARLNVAIVPLASDLRCTTALAWRDADHRPMIAHAAAEATAAFAA